MIETPLDFEDYSIHDAQHRRNSNDSCVSYKSSKFDVWIAETERQLEEGVTAKPAHGPEPSYTMEHLSTPLKRWRRLLRSAKSPKGARRWRQERNGVKCRKRKTYSGDDANVSPKYFEPWHWKGTTRRPYRYDSDDDSEDGSSNTVITVIVVIAVIACVVLLVKNKDAIQEWLGIGQFFDNDFNAVKVKVEGDVKDMINSDFKDISWKYEDQRDAGGKSFETAVEENDPSVIEHIRNFEEHLKKKPGKFFPGGGRNTQLLPLRGDRDR